MSQFKSAVAFTFPHDKKEGQKKQPESKLTPGPGAYTWDKIPKKIPPAIKISESKRPLHKKYDGPNAKYPVQEFMGKEGPKYTMSSKEGKDTTIEKELARKPAPCHYNPKIYAQFKTLGKNISFHKKIPQKSEISDTPAPGAYNNTFGMITKHEDRKYLTMSKTTRKYIENYGKVSHGTTKELLRPSTVPKYGFCEQQIGTDHGLTKQQVQKGKIYQKNKIKKQEEEEQNQIKKQQEFKAKYNKIPKQKRKPDANIMVVDSVQPTFGFGTFKKGQEKMQVKKPIKYQTYKK